MRWSDLAYWPRQYLLGFIRLWQFNGPLPAAEITLLNLLRVRRRRRVDLFGFALTIRTGAPDLAVAIDSLGDEFAPLAGLADPAGLIVDAGGYIGTAALKLAALFPQSRIICLEPSPENLALLRENTARVGNIVVMAAALAATRGEAVLRDAGSGEWGFSIATGMGAELARVPTVTIADILAHEDRDRLFVLKLDVEGAERDILAASAGWLDRTEIVIAELHEGLAPGATAAFGAATRGRHNRRLPGEKVISSL